MDRFTRSLAVRLVIATAAAAFVLGATALAQGKPKADPPVKEVRPPTLEELRTLLRDREPRARQRAVKALATLATREAWLEVVGALADRESAVADEAQIALGALGDARLVRELCGKLGLESKDALVARRVAEALGRMPIEVDGEALARALDPRDEELARMTAWSIERLAAARHLTGRPERIARALDDLAQSRRAGEASCAALVALSAVSPGVAEPLAAAWTGDRDPARRCAGLLVAARVDSGRARSYAIRALADGETRVRATAIDVLAIDGTRAALAALVEALAKDPRIRLRWRIVDVLQRASGLRHRMDPRAWKAWVESLGETGPPRRPQVDATRESAGAPGETTRAAGLNVPLYSDRACFLFDFSGSMWTPLADGRVPKDIVAVELRKTLERIEPGCHLNLVPFTYDPLPWEKELQPATPSNVKRALAFFDECQAKGRGNYFDAALFALADPGVDTIVALTDGVPTGGVHSDVDLVVDLLVERNRFRRAAYDSILVDAPPGYARRWRDLAQRTGGRCIEVEMDKR